MPDFKPGQTAKVRFKTRNQAKVLTDPTTVTVQVKDPSNPLATYTYAAAEIIRESAGIYYKELGLGIEGQWYVRVIATGNGVDWADESSFFVNHSAVV